MKKFLYFLLLTFLFIPNVKAKGISIMSSSFKVEPNNTLKLDIVLDEKVKGGSFKIGYNKNNIIFDNFSFENGINGKLLNNVYTFSSNDLITGKIGTITLNAKDNALNQNINIVISDIEVINELGVKEKYSNVAKTINCEKISDATIKEITSNEFKISSFDPNVYEYTIYVENDLESYDVKAIPTDSKTKVVVSKTDFIDSMAKVTLTATAQDNSKKIYTINLIKKEYIKLPDYKKDWVIVSIVLSVFIIICLFLVKKDK